MASKQTYECYVCKGNGFTDVRVYLDGKDENGKTIYKNEDMSAHNHKQLSQQQPKQPKQPTELTEIFDKLQGLEAQITHLTKLVYALTQSQQSELQKK